MIYGTEGWGIRQIRHYHIYLALFQELVVVVVVKGFMRCAFASKTNSIVVSISNNNALMPFDLIHCDMWDAYYIKFFCDASYFLTILDDASRCVWVYLMRDKSEASKIVKDFYAMIQTRFK